MVTINGERKEVPAATTLAELLATVGARPEQVAIELNRVIVKREKWPETQVGADAEIEIVQFVGGG